MARVSKAYLEARRRQILQAAQRCFTRDGFHTAPMLDIVREAGLGSYPRKPIIAAQEVEYGRMRSCSHPR